MANGNNNYKSTAIQYGPWHFRAVGPVWQHQGAESKERAVIFPARGALVEYIGERELVAMQPPSRALERKVALVSYYGGSNL